MVLYMRFMKLCRNVILFSVLYFVFIIGAVCAEEYAFNEPKLENGMLVLSGKALPDDRITVKVTRKGAPGGDIAKVYYADELLADESGVFCVQFYLLPLIEAEDLTGEYSVFLKATNKAVVSKSFSYVDYTAVLKKIKDADTALELMEIFDNNSEPNGALASLGIDVVKYSLLTDDEKLAVFGNVLYNKPEEIEKFNEKFHTYLGLALINKKEKEHIKAGFDLINPVYDGKLFSDADEKTVEYIVSMFVNKSNISDKTALDLLYEETLLIYQANNATIGQLMTLMANKNVILSSATEKSRYLSANNERKTEIAVALVNMLDINNVTTYKEFGNLLDIAVKDVLKNVYIPSGGGGGSGGGASSSKGGNSLMPVNPTADENTNKPSSGIYADVPVSHWAYEATNYLSEKNILSGYGDGKFLPSQSITRQEFIKVVVTAFDLTQTDIEPEFADVDKNDWAYSYIKIAFASGIITGTGDNYFGKEENITRQDMAVIIDRVINIKGIITDEIKEYKKFTDENNMAEYAYSAVKKLYCTGFIAGYDDGSFKPRGVTSRSEAAQLIYNVLKSIPGGLR